MPSRVETLGSLGARIGTKRLVVLVVIVLAFLVPNIFSNEYHVRVAITITILSFQPRSQIA